MQETATSTPVQELNQLPHQRLQAGQVVELHSIENVKENPNIWTQLSSTTASEAITGTTAAIETPFNEEAVPEAGGSEHLARNIERLEAAGEVGQFLSGVLQIAIEENPQLAIAIIATGGRAKDLTLGKTGGYARHKDINPDGEYSITVNTDDGFEHYEELLKTRQTAAEISAKKMGIDPSEMDAKTLAGFIFAHELGHIGDYMQNAPTRQLKDERRKRDLATLPVPGLDPSQLATYLGREDGQAYFASNRETLASKGIATVEQLIKAQEIGYRDLETEDIPDQFAAKVMAKVKADNAAAVTSNPELAEKHVAGIRATIDELHKTIEPVEVPKE